MNSSDPTGLRNDEGAANEAYSYSKDVSPDDSDGSEDTTKKEVPDTPKDPKAVDTPKPVDKTGEVQQDLKKEILDVAAAGKVPDLKGKATEQDAKDKLNSQDPFVLSPSDKIVLGDKVAVFPKDDRNLIDRLLNKDAEKYNPYFVDNKTGEITPAVMVTGVVPDVTPGAVTSAERIALSQLTTEAAARGMTKAEATTLTEWARELGTKGMIHGPHEAPVDFPHAHIGGQNHIPIK